MFNALAGEKISIVKDTPGVTRDRIYADVTWLDKEFTMIDTGGIEPDSKDVILSPDEGTGSDCHRYSGCNPFSDRCQAGTDRCGFQSG